MRAHTIVRLAARIVPARLRPDWTREWEAELFAASSSPDAPLVRHALGSFSDAFWIRQREVLDLELIDDLRHGWRQLCHHAGFAFMTVGILSLSLAASVTAFSVVSQILLRPLPYPDADRIVTLWERRPHTAGKLDVAPGNFVDWRARQKSFTQLAAGDPYSYDYTGGERPEVLRAVNVTEGFFDIFGAEPLAGRFFRPEEHKKGNHQVVVISERFWRRRLSANPGIVGQAIPLDGTSYTVVGIVSDDFQPHFQGEAREVYAAKVIEEYEPRIRVSGYWNVVGRLKDGVSLDQARAEMDAISTQIETENPVANKGMRAEVLTLRDHLVGDVRSAVVLFSGAVLAVLLIACVNVTNLLLARGATRQHELAVRTALGASRGRIVGQLLVETLLLTSVATAVAVVLAQGAMAGLASVGPRELPWIETLHVDGQALVFASLLAVLVAVASGLVPAIRMSSTGLQAPGNRTMTGDRSQRRLRFGLVAVEVALALMLVTGSGLLIKSFVNLLSVDAGFQKDGVAVLQVFAWDRNPTPAALRSFFDRALARVAALPGVQSVAAVQAMPFIESNIDIQSAMRFVDQPPPPPGSPIRASINVVTPSYFKLLGIPLLKGRLFDDRDGPQAPKVCLVSEAFAERYLHGINPVGQRVELRVGGPQQVAEIVGVVGALRHERLDQAPRAEVMVSFQQTPSGSMTILARTAVDPATLVEPAKAEIWSIDPLQTFYRTATLDELVGRTLSARRFALIVLTGFAGLGLLLAAAGLYGVLSTIVSQYRREIGVRMALGAAWSDIIRLILVRGLGVAALGVAVGLVGVLGGARVLKGFLFSVAPTDPITIAGAAVLMLVVAGAACYFPARRAAGSDPMEALRFE